MSTQLRRLAQAPAHSPARAKFFLTLVAINTGGTGNAGAAAVSLGAGQTFADVMTSTAFDAAAADIAANIGVNAVLRDLGRSITVTNTDGDHLYRYRQVQAVGGSGSEGVYGSSPDWTSDIYVLVWSASGSGVNVARTG